MKSLVISLLLVVALVVAAEGIRRAAIIEDTLATADEQLTTGGATSRESDAAIDDALDLVARLPVLGPRLEQQVRLNRATQAYWQREYGALLSGPLAPVAGENDADMQLLAANSAFRRALAGPGTPQALARGLDDVLKAYGGVMDIAPGNVSAAYNYEFAARLRTILAAGRPSGVPSPESSNMQGEQGDPPEGTRKSDFNVIVPLRPEERQEQLDPGAGAEFKRQG